MKSILKIYIKKFLKEASAAQHGDDDTDLVLADLERKGYDVSRNKNFKGDFSSNSGYFIEPKNLRQEVAIRSAITITKNFKGDLVRQDTRGLKTKLFTPYLLKSLRSKILSNIGKALINEGFVRISILIPVEDPTKRIIYNKDKIVKDDIVIYDIHMYFNPITKQCAMPKFKLTSQIANRVEF